MSHLNMPWMHAHVGLPHYWGPQRVPLLLDARKVRPAAHRRAAGAAKVGGKRSTRKTGSTRKMGSTRRRSSGSRQWITHKGSLGGPGYLSRPAGDRHAILAHCVRMHGEKSCLGKIQALQRSASHIRPSFRQALAVDHTFLTGHYGAMRR